MDNIDIILNKFKMNGGGGRGIRLQGIEPQ